MNVIERTPVTVACLRYTGPYGKPLTTFWQTVFIPWMEQQALLTQPRYGIGLDNPAVTPAAQCRYDACVEVAADYVPTDEVIVRTIPGGLYAVFGFKGTVSHIGAAWAAILRDWIPPDMLDMGTRPAFSYYPVNSAYSAEMDAFECELLVPIAYAPDAE